MDTDIKEFDIFSDSADCKIKVDKATMRGSIIDTIVMATHVQERSHRAARKAAARTWSRLKKRYPLLHGLSYNIRINGKGCLHPVTDMSTCRRIASLVIASARMSTSQKRRALRQFGIDSEVITSPIESDVIEIFIRVFIAYQPMRQFAVQSYRIDLYLVKSRIVIECDENGHSEYCPDAERNRMVEITQSLNCQWVRFDPYKEGFNVGTVISEIYDIINKCTH